MIDPLASVQRSDAHGDRDELQGELAGKSGKQYWKSLEALSGTDSFREFIAREYPSQLEVFQDLPERRTFLKVMGASLALAGISSCTRQPKEIIHPFAKSPETYVPGNPLYFATAMPWANGAIGLLVEAHQGRPTKIEGNPSHPASLGSTDALTQASILGLYDPDRSVAVTHTTRQRTFDQAQDALRAAINEQSGSAKQGAGLRILTPTVVSPTLAELLQETLTRLPRAKWVQFESINRDHARAGAIQAFGQDVTVHASFDRAKVVLSLDDDFLGGGPEQVRAAREFAQGRKARNGATAMSRLYVVESSTTNTGAMADHRRAKRSEDVEDLARRLAVRLGLAIPTGDKTRNWDGLDPWIEALARDLEGNAGASLIVVGDAQPAPVHAIAHALNAKLGNVGKTVRYLPPVEIVPQPKGQHEMLRDLVAEMRAGAVETLVVLGGNPVVDAPADLDFAAALDKVPLRFHVGLYADETAELCHWHVNEAHYLESWGDVRAFDGTVSIVQPLIAPLYDGHSALEIAAILAGRAGTSAYDLVRAHWSRATGEADFEKRWRRWLHDGVVPNTQVTPLDVAARAAGAPPTPPVKGLEIVFRPDPCLWDGRFANSGWLQELPKPLTRLTWDNAVHLSPTTAQKLGVANGDVVELSLGGRTARGPVWVTAGHADDCATVFLGSGRKKAGRVGTGVGFDANALRTSSAPWSAGGLQITKTGETTKLATTQDHENYAEADEREILRVRSFEGFKAKPDSLDPVRREELASAHLHHMQQSSLYDKVVAQEIANNGRTVSEYQWGMVIDLSACTACNACVVACQAENNIPVVGKEQVLRGREMHWIRIDRYFEGSPSEPLVHQQPVPCMQCENAPCETVCPVGATVHSDEGLNDMVYNRCVGTRYCANNCPYKVRRFNFLLYSDFVTESLKLQRNPDVTVRSRGVMEKCTYCVQRINLARQASKREDRKIQEGEIVTACQQVCPTQAITFGDISEPASAVSKLRAEPHNYGLIEELNTRPRTTYLAKVRNPNKEIETSDQHG